MHLHPECLPDEQFVGNVDKQRHPIPTVRHLQGMRLGVDAYDIHGEKLPDAYAPLFVKQEHLAAYNMANAAETARLKRGYT